MAKSQSLAQHALVVGMPVAPATGRERLIRSQVRRRAHAAYDQTHTHNRRDRGVRTMTQRGTGHRRESGSSPSFSLRRPSGHAQEARALVARAREHERRGAVAEASVAFDMAVAVVDGAPASPLHADLHRWHGTLLFDIGSTSEADALFRRSLETSQFIRYGMGIARAQAALARVAQRRGDLAAARRQYDDASLNAVASGDHGLFACVEQYLGTLSLIAGDMEDAAHRFRLSLRALRESGDEGKVAWALDNLAQLHLLRGRQPDAAEAIREGMHIAERLASAPLRQWLSATTAQVALAAGNIAESEAANARALSIASGRGDRVGRAIALRLQARLQAQRQAIDEAIGSLESARALAAQGADLLLAARVLVDLGDVVAARGDAARARTAWEQARAAYVRLGMPPESLALGRRLSDPR